MCSRLIPSLQLPPILNHTIRICQRATRLVFAHSGDRQGQMASGDLVQSRGSNPLRTRSPREKRKCCHLSQLSLSPLLYFNASMRTNTCVCIIPSCVCMLFVCVPCMECTVTGKAAFPVLYFLRLFKRGKIIMSSYHHY